MRILRSGIICSLYSWLPVTLVLLIGTAWDLILSRLGLRVDNLLNSLLLRMLSLLSPLLLRTTASSKHLVEVVLLPLLTERGWLRDHLLIQRTLLLICISMGRLPGSTTLILGVSVL